MPLVVVLLYLWAGDNSRDHKSSFKSLNLFLFWKGQFHWILINALCPGMLCSYRRWKYMLCSVTTELFFHHSIHFFMNLSLTASLAGAYRFVIAHTSTMSRNISKQHLFMKNIPWRASIPLDSSYKLYKRLSLISCKSEDLQGSLNVGQSNILIRCGLQPFFTAFFSFLFKFY